MATSGASTGQSASALISQKVAALADWRGDALARVRKLIHEEAPDVVEEWKWVKPTNPGTPVWEHNGIICTGETYKDKVKLTFMKGAALKDPTGLFNSSLDGNARRALDIFEGDEPNASDFKRLIREAISLNAAGKTKPATKSKA